jgi:hypothetical protein
MTGRAGYPEPPFVADEATTLLGSLERQRATFAYKCADLDAAGMRTRVAASELSIARLLKHVAWMEDLNFTCGLAAAAVPRPWSEVPRDQISTWAFESAEADPPELLHGLWDAAVDRSRAAVDQFLVAGDPALTYPQGGRAVSLRRLLVDMIEEYGRHTGHADLIREAIDGRTGEDPPGPAYAYARPEPV